MKEKQIIIQCPACRGTGNGERITREMALDGGCPELEGTPSFCLRCGGSGADVDVVYDDAEEARLIETIKKESAEMRRKHEKRESN